MPSSKLNRSPARTLSAIGFNRESVMVSSLISSPSSHSNTPKGSRRAPKQQEQHTNIAVHGEKRSVQLAQVVRFHKRMLVRKQCRHDRDSRPRRPRQSEAERQPREQPDHAYVHSPCNQQRIRDPKFSRDGKKPGLLVEVHILAPVEHVTASDPQLHRSA